MRDNYTIKEPSLGSLVIFGKKRTLISQTKNRLLGFGIMISSKEAIVYKRKFLLSRKKPCNALLDDLPKPIRIYRHVDDRISISIGAYFLSNKSNYRLFHLGANKILANDYDFFNSANIMPTHNEYIDPDTYERKWEEIISIAEQGDLIFTYDTRSIISKIIARLDGGSWSHVAMYSGNGSIIESIAPVAIERDIRCYKNCRYHVGLYRLRTKQLSNDEREAIVKSTKENLGTPYGYILAALVGICALFNKKVPFHLNDGSAMPVGTPNSIIYTGDFALLAYV